MAMSSDDLYSYLVQNFPTKFSYKKSTIDPTIDDTPAIVPSYWLNTSTEKLWFYSGETKKWKEAGSSGGGLTPQAINANTNAEIGTLYLCDVSSNEIILDLSNFLTLNTDTGLYECNLEAGANFEVYIVKGDTTLNAVTLSFTGLQANPYNYNLNLEGESGSDFIFDNNSYFRFTYSGDPSIGFKINSMTGSSAKNGIIGSVTPFAGFTAPSGYFFADGSSKSRVDYEELFNVLTFSTLGTLTSGTKNITTSSTNNLYIGEKVEGTGIPLGTTITSITNSTTFVISNNATITGSTSILVIPYGSLTSTTFKLPNYKGRFITMPDGTSDFKAVGMSGGSSTHTNTLEELVPHKHKYNLPNNWTAKLGAWLDYDETVKGTSSTSTDTTSTGGVAGVATPYSILNPYVCTNYIIKY